MLGMYRRSLFALSLIFVPLLARGETDAAAAQRKMDQIQSDRLPAGTRVSLTARELNAWVREQVRRSYPQAVRQAEITLGSDVASGSALVDFAKLQRAQGEPPGWLASQLLEGERPVRVTVRLRSANGRAQVDVQSVEVSGVTISGPLLEFLIRNYLLPNFPSAKVGEPFDLSHRMERIDVRPAVVNVLIGR